MEEKDDEIEEFKLKPILSEDLTKIMKKLKGNRSSGIDFIDGYSIKLAYPVIGSVLIHLVNLSIEKNSILNYGSLQKKGNRSYGEHYRPVSYIVVVSKIAEAAIFDLNFHHFDQNSAHTDGVLAHELRTLDRLLGPPST